MTKIIPKDIYIDSRLEPLLLAARRKPREWIFSLGRPWLLLTPRRLARLAGRLGLADNRVGGLIERVRRHSSAPEKFCRPIGLEAEAFRRAGDYPPAVCPECDGVHQPHPLDANQPCGECRERERRLRLRRPGPLEEGDREADRKARQVLREKEPALFNGEELSPNWRINFTRRLDRDWDAAVNRILTGGTYRAVAREFDCSVGLLHKKVRERNFWEDN